VWGVEGLKRSCARGGGKVLLAERANIVCSSVVVSCRGESECGRRTCACVCALTYVRCTIIVIICNNNISVPILYYYNMHCIYVRGGSNECSAAGER